MERSTACKRPRAALDGGGGGAAWRSCRVARAAAGGKDRHSKVVTARGLRDRRVRLSVPTAIQFYDIQDRLGVDQPSKAIEWLIRAAAAAIDELPSLDCSFSLPAAPSPPPPPPAGGDDADADVSTSETSKSSVLSLANNGGAFADLLHCSAADDKPMQQQQQPTLAYYPVQLQPPSSHVTPGMSFETMPQLAFLQEPQHPAVVFDRGTLQSNAVAAAPLWPPTQHPCLLQRFASTAPADAAGLPFFLGGGAAPATSTAERRIQLWDFKQERKA
ncbi:hypothetical protein PR202_ga11838 [Eleusine coracana subsp. coracana]|uniref:TCP domain-containing protein n=1 Tax=Eleusine coracana subsp. coracana TaxID=191504 RepID=A0AAV5CA17_ELECO|nr:hypothetical protein PR202_ga11838 [Eleusine coracana subsp. coracana]